MIKAILALTEEVAVEVAWHQWSGLGASTFSDKAIRATLIDPEALVLLSLTMQASERRLRDFIVWWARVGAPLLSVQRMKALQKRFPDATASHVQSFAWLAQEAGDKRWKSYASQQPDWTIRAEKGSLVPCLQDSEALLVRLRAGFGVSAKADVMALLIGLAGTSATVQVIAHELGYSKVTVRKVLTDMVQAQFVHIIPGHPARYYVNTDAWQVVLGNAKPTPRWVYWSSLFAFLAHTFALFQPQSKGSAYLLSSRARDLTERFGAAFAYNQIPTPDVNSYPGEAFLDVYFDLLNALQGWIKGSAEGV